MERYVFSALCLWSAYSNDKQKTFPRFQWLGEIPFIIPDVPINAIFLILFLTVGGAHGYLYLRNRSQERNFIINLFLTSTQHHMPFLANLD